MKKLLFLAATAFVLATGTSCKDDECPAPTYPVEGLWVGKYGNGTATPASGFSMVVEAGGKVTVADGDNITSSSKASGTWTLTGNVFKATYTYSTPGGSTFTIQANWGNNGKMTSGTWGSGSNPTGSGTWFMDRRN
ncbi:MAG: hypothetical protein JNM68_15500 [Dinghuibacter sp.]|nr:hypothetical protein [Dinghuibacter sp.]